MPQNLKSAQKMGFRSPRPARFRVPSSNYLARRVSRLERSCESFINMLKLGCELQEVTLSFDQKKLLILVYEATIYPYCIFSSKKSNIF